MHLFHFAPAFAVIAMGTSGDNICPDMLSAHMPGHYVIYCQVAFPLSAVLASIIVPTKDLPTSQLDVWTRPMNLVLQPDD